MAHAYHLMVRWALLGLFCTMLSVTIAAEIRDSICIIKPQTSEIGQKLYLDIADSFQRAGYDDLASEFKREGEGEPYGSGFLVKASDGSLWVVTNRHVVQNATQAKLVFENGSGIATTLEFCPVTVVDDHLDLAFIELPAPTPPYELLKYFEFSNQVRP